MLCILFTSWQITPINPPTWANGTLYAVWFLLVFYCMTIISMTPSGVVLFLSCKLFGLPRAILITFLFIYFFSYYIKQRFPIFVTTEFALGCAISAGLFFVVFKERLKKVT